MHNKLTLRLEESLITKVKIRAKKQGKSVSQFIADYINFLESPSQKELPPLTKKLKGILKDSSISEKDYQKYLEDKYL